MEVYLGDQQLLHYLQEMPPESEEKMQMMKMVKMICF